MSRRLFQLPALPRRPRDGHKGTFGRVLVIAGSVDMPGAAHLSALGALRGGAGLVTVASPRGAIDRIAASTPCATFLSLAENGDGGIGTASLRRLLDRASLANAIVIGPGLGSAADTGMLVRSFVARVDRPLVIDADGLNHLNGAPDLLADRAAPTVLTPHPGELSRLDGLPIPEGDADRKRRAEALAIAARAIVVLKGAKSVVTDGTQTYINPTGNPGMATAGSGDVLSGLVTAFLASHPNPLGAVALAVAIHGIAGDLAAAALSPEAMIASDLLDHFGGAFEQTRRSRPGTKRAKSVKSGNSTSRR